jgi:hypothetical protein
MSDTLSMNNAAAIPEALTYIGAGDEDPMNVFEPCMPLPYY